MSLTFKKTTAQYDITTTEVAIVASEKKKPECEKAHEGRRKGG